MRPYTLDYIKSYFTDFQELAGDRHYMLMIKAGLFAGLARLDRKPVMIIGQQKRARH